MKRQMHWMLGGWVALGLAIVRRVDSPIEAGFFGQDVDAIRDPLGAVVSWPGTARSSELAAPLREGEPATLTLVGEQGELAFFCSGVAGCGLRGQLPAQTQELVGPRAGLAQTID